MENEMPITNEYLPADKQYIDSLWGDPIVDEEEEKRLYDKAEDGEGSIEKAKVITVKVIDILIGLVLVGMVAVVLGIIKL
jgi:hypothetical protein